MKNLRCLKCDLGGFMDINYKELYEQEKQRADLLQDDLNSVDILHYDECASLRAEIALLKQQLKMKGVN